MARSAVPITLTSETPAISWDELSTCLAEASAILWAVKQRRDALKQRHDARLQAEAALLEVQEERLPKPKEHRSSTAKEQGL